MRRHYIHVQLPKSEKIGFAACFATRTALRFNGRSRAFCAQNMRLILKFQGEQGDEQEVD
jgi:hypothetical protein